MPAAETLRILGAALCLTACGSSGDATDAGADVIYGHHSLDAAPYEAEPPETGPLDRMEQHSGIVLPTPHIFAIYIGDTGLDAYAPFDMFLTWMFGSTDYWSILSQYGVGYGTFEGSVYVDFDTFFTPGMIMGSIVDSSVLDARVKAVIHQAPSDAGVSDSGGDAGDAAAPLPAIPSADGYIFFLPDGVNVNLGGEGQTCVGIGGYHSFDGNEPYAIIPSCGRTGLVVSHEMAEMCTDPVPGLGWYSDADQSNAGGEVGDLCNYVVSVDGNYATALWSNKDGQCEP